MMFKHIRSLGAGLLCMIIGSVASANSNNPLEHIEKGGYLFKVAGCESCHTDPDYPDDSLAGGLKMETPFGNFFTPNITPDKETGIGGWTDQQFIQAVKQGLSPDGEHYFPAFPYTSYTKISDQELIDLKAYLDSQPAVLKKNREHELSFPFNQRWLLSFWKGMFFEEGEFQQNPIKSKAWNRGSYIVSGPGHCVECHSPRNILGGLDTDQLLTGNPKSPEGEKIPSIHAARNPKFNLWEREDIRFALETGVTLEGDVMGGSMAHVIDNSTSQLSPEDLDAVAEYLAEPL